MMSEEIQEQNLIVQAVHQSHRSKADIVHPSRLQGFSDAVFATAATLLIVPVRKFEIEKGETLKTELCNRWPQFIVFLMGYLVICTIWELHIIRYKVVQKVDDIVVALTLVSLMVTTFLPFTVALEGHYGNYGISIILNCSMLLALDLIEAAIFIYAFHNPHLLSKRFRELEPAEMRVKKRQIYVKIFINCSLFIVAAIFSLASFMVSWVLISAVIITPLLRHVMIKLTNKCSSHCHGTNVESTYEVLLGQISKERIECFSDAAIAIVATLLILDLTAEDFPSKAEVDKKGLSKALAGMWEMFVAYMGTYTMIGYLWFVHHSVLHHVKLFTPLMVLINKIFLAFLAATPFISTLVNKYTGESTYNSRVAVGVSCVIIFASSFSNVMLLMCALWKKQITFYDWALPSAGDGSTNRIHNYLLLKTLIIPLVSLITFCASLATNSASYVTYHVALFVVPVLFISLKIVYACYCWRQDNSPLTSSQHSPRGSIVDIPIPDIASKGVDNPAAFSSNLET